MMTYSFSAKSLLKTDENQLRQLVLATCSQPRGSLERQRRLNQLIWHIQRSGKVLRGAGVPNYEDALQQTWLYFCRNLCEAVTADPYDSTKASVLTWINAYLKRRLQDNYQTVAAQQARTLSWQPSDADDISDPIANLPARPDVPPILDEIQAWLEQDSKQLRRVHVRDRPDINCQVLIQRRLPPETSWEQLSQEFGVAIATLSNFYQRECFPRLLSFGQSQGYL